MRKVYEDGDHPIGQQYIESDRLSNERAAKRNLILKSKYDELEKYDGCEGVWHQYAEDIFNPKYPFVPIPLYTLFFQSKRTYADKVIIRPFCEVKVMQIEVEAPKKLFVEFPENEIKNIFFKFIGEDNDTLWHEIITFLLWV